MTLSFKKKTSFHLLFSYWRFGRFIY